MRFCISRQKCVRIQTRPPSVGDDVEVGFGLALLLLRLLHHRHVAVVVEEHHLMNKQVIGYLETKGLHLVSNWKYSRYQEAHGYPSFGNFGISNPPPLRLHFTQPISNVCPQNMAILKPSPPPQCGRT